MDPKGSKKVYFSRLQAVEIENLERDDIFLLLTKGRDLFSRLSMTPDAERFLAANPDLAEVVEKW